MKLSLSSKPLNNLIRRAIESRVIDGWTQHGPYIVFLNGTARFYVRKHEVEEFVHRLIGGAGHSEPLAA